jgi:hypothetical protein
MNMVISLEYYTIKVKFIDQHMDYQLIKNNSSASSLRLGYL